MVKIIYLEGEQLQSKYADAIFKTILDLSLKKGDEFEIFPFNYFRDERTDYKEEVLSYHTTLKLKNFKYTMIESWNSSIKSKIEIYLVRA